MKKSHCYLISFGNITLRKVKTKNMSFCVEYVIEFNYHGIEKSICGKTGQRNSSKLKRILVIQMK